MSDFLTLTWSLEALGVQYSSNLGVMWTRKAEARNSHVWLEHKRHTLGYGCETPIAHCLTLAVSIFIFGAVPTDNSLSFNRKALLYD
jgi:hypothetical protein